MTPPGRRLSKKRELTRDASRWRGWNHRRVVLIKVFASYAKFSTRSRNYGFGQYITFSVTFHEMPHWLTMNIRVRESSVATFSSVNRLGNTELSQSIAQFAVS